MEINNIDIFVATHKDGKFFSNNNIYKYVQAGTTLNKKINNVKYDNTGDNISELNPYYCELTVFYWGWKNSNADIKGLCHYRRFFSNSRIDGDDKYFLNGEQINKDLESYDIILGEPTYYMYKKNKDTYTIGSCGKADDLEILRSVLEEFYPEYLIAFDDVMNSYKMSYCNMMIAKSRIYNVYAEWLFSVLRITEQRIDISTRTGNQKRIYGYFAERLLNVWVKKNNLNIKYYPIVKIEESYDTKNKIKCMLDHVGIYYMLQNVKDFILFEMTNKSR